MGDFDEGKCFKLDLVTGMKYILCSLSVGKVDYMMDIIQSKAKAKLLEQPNPLESLATADRNFIVDDDKFDMGQYIEDELKGKHSTELTDIGDWSVCDHVCGGGIQLK